MNTSVFPLRNLNFVYFCSYFKKKSANIKNMVQIRPILYSFQPIILQMFFRVSDKESYNSGLLIFRTFETLACKFLVLEIASSTWFLGLVDVCFESEVTLCYTSFGKVRFKFFAYYLNRNLFSKCLFFSFEFNASGWSSFNYSNTVPQSCLSTIVDRPNSYSDLEL